MVTRPHSIRFLVRVVDKRFLETNHKNTLSKLVRVEARRRCVSLVQRHDVVADSTARKVSTFIRSLPRARRWRSKKNIRRPRRRRANSVVMPRARERRANIAPDRDIELKKTWTGRLSLHHNGRSEAVARCAWWCPTGNA